MMPSDHGSQLDELRDVGGEIDALAALALESFDRADWSGADPLVVERMTCVLDMIAKSAVIAICKLDGFHLISEEFITHRRGV